MKKIVNLLLTMVLLLSSMPLEKLEASQLYNKINDINDIFSYENNENGFYPTNNTSNYGTGENQNIKNYNYGLQDPIIYNINPNQPLDFSNGYLEYGTEEKGRSNTKKYIQPTTHVGEYLVTLDTIGDGIKEKPKVDIVMVLDKSSSMKWDTDNKPNNRWNNLLEASNNFFNFLEASPLDYQIGVVSYGSTGGAGNAYGEVASFGAISGNEVTNAYTSDINALRKHAIFSAPVRNSGTPTALGVDLGIQTLSSNNNGGRGDAVKILINITDGGPTFYPTDQYYKNGIDFLTTDESIAKITTRQKTN